MQGHGLLKRFVRCGVLPALAGALALAAAPAALAASGDLSWSHTVDSPPHWNDFGSLVSPAPNGTVYVAGTWAEKMMMESGDITLLRLKASKGATGPVLWQKTWNDAAHNLEDMPSCLITDPDGNAIVAGASYAGELNSDIVVIKWTPGGKRVWVARYASPYGMADYAMGLKCDGKGNVYLAGFRYLVGNEDADWVVAKFRASDGRRLWARVWSGTERPASDDRAWGLTVDAAGYSYSVGSSDDAAGVADAIVMKRTPAGKLAWIRRVDGAAHGADSAQAVALAGDKVYVAGSSAGVAGNRLMLLKYRTRGTRLWQRSWLPPGTDSGSLKDLAVDRAGNAVVVGTVASGDRAFFMVGSWTPGGESRWAKTYVPLPGANAHGASVVVNRAGTVWAAGSSNTTHRGILLKCSATGNLLWARSPSIDGTTTNNFVDLCLWGSSSLAAVGTTDGDVTQYDLFVAKYVR